MSTLGVEFSSSGIRVTAQLFPTPYLSNRLNIPFSTQLAQIYLLDLDFTRLTLSALRDRQKDLKWVLYKCPNCETHLPIPAEWESGRCRKCQMLFRSMIKHQKPARTTELMDISVST